MFCAVCRRLFWRDPKPAGRLPGRSRTSAVRTAAVETRSSVRAMEEHGRGIREKVLANAEAVRQKSTWGSFKAVSDVKLDRLLDGVRLAAEQHGCDDSDLPHYVRRQHSCDGLGSFDLGWIRNKNLELFASRCIV
jgi:hypothetical protein